MNGWRWLGLLVSGAVGTACAETSRAVPATMVRDSAGITVVDNREAVWRQGESWHLGAAPVLRLGGRDAPGHDLFQVAGALRLEDGRVVVADEASGELRYFDPGGRWTHSVGGRGDGPGEFRRLRSMGRYGVDSLMTWDARARRVSVFHLDGTFARAYGLSQPGFSVRTILPSGSVVATAMRAIHPEPGTEYPVDVALRVRRPYALFDALGALQTDLGAVPDDEIWSSYDVDHPHRQRRLFGMRTVTAATPGVLWLGTGETFELRGYDASGNHVRTVRNLSYEPWPVREVDRRAWMAPWQAALDESNLHMVPVFEAQLLPEKAGPYDALLTDAEGNLWLRTFTRAGATADSWVVMDPTGRLMGRVDVPSGLEVTEIGRDHVLGVTRDRLGVERVELYELRKQ